MVVTGRHAADDGGVTYRRASAADAAAAARLITLALHDLDARDGRPPRHQPPEMAEPAMRHLVETDGARFWIAEAAGSPAGFGVGMVRGTPEDPGRLWFLAGLFIHPDWQCRGIGRVLLERALDGFPAAGGVLAVDTSAANGQSNSLYGQYGMYPLMPLLPLARALPDAPAGPPRPRAQASGGRLVAPAPGALDLGAVGLEAVPLGAGHADQVRTIDLSVLGVDRTVDHDWLRRTMKRAGWLFLRAGAPAGYGYLGGDGSQVPDQVGPLAAVDAADQPALAAFLLGRAGADGWRSASFMVPGANIELQRYLWAAGFAMSGTAGLFGASRPFGRLDRYAFIGDALM